MDFYRRVQLVCQAIPYGRVTSYGQIAFLCGRPRNARQVGYALGHCPWAGTVPAHRVVNSQGILSGAGSFGGLGTQCRLLQAEGVEVLDRCRVDLRRYGWKNTPQQASALLALFAQEGV